MINRVSRVLRHRFQFLRISRLIAEAYDALITALGWPTDMDVIEAYASFGERLDVKKSYFARLGKAHEWLQQATDVGQLVPMHETMTDQLRL